jgi:D-glycero-D-manno-heptose 1,7-bisphosphate phosphatase
VVLAADALPATALLRAAGFELVIVTNQPDVARGSTRRADAEAINEVATGAMGIEAIYTCWHDGRGCACRKPKPGLLLAAARDLDLDLGASWLIGDRWTDIAAAAAAGVRSVLLERPYSWGRSRGELPPTTLAPDASAATIS